MSSKKKMSDRKKETMSPITCPECGRVATNWRGDLYPISAPGDWVECIARFGGCGHAWPVFRIPPQNLEKPRLPVPPVVNADGSVTLDVQEAVLSGDFEGAFLAAFAQMGHDDGT